jgi:cytidylate kinase
VVFPAAEVKIYLDADLETRARRRHREMQSRGIAATLEEVRADLERRDARDRDRPEAPLAQAPQAVILDTTRLDAEAQIEAVLAVVRAHPRCPVGESGHGVSSG